MKIKELSRQDTVKRHRHYFRKGTKRMHLEALESRLLLSGTINVTWIGGHDSDKGGNVQNWEISGTGGSPDTAPNSGDYAVTIGTNATITMDGDYSVNSLTVSGGTAVTLTFDAANRTFDVLPNSEDFSGGYIHLDQTAGRQASLTLAANAGNPAITVNTSYLAAIGDRYLRRLAA